jgi:hypothetical protein
MYKLCKMATKPPTVAKLKELLKLAEVAYSSKDKKDYIVRLCLKVVLRSSESRSLVDAVFR